MKWIKADMKHTMCLTNEEVSHYIQRAKNNDSDINDSGCMYFKRDGLNPVRVMPIGDDFQVDVVPCLGY